MVRVNSLLVGDDPIATAYLRSLHEMGCGLELCLLSAVNYLIAHDDKNIPSPLLVATAPYLRELGVRYHKQAIRAIDGGTPDARLEAAGLIVRAVQKTIEYSFSDLHDLLAEEPSQIDVPPVVGLRTIDAMRRFHKSPLHLVTLPDTDIPMRRSTGRPRLEDPFTFMMRLADSVRERAEWEGLKFYDFLLEERPRVYSTPVYEVRDALLRLGEDYAKLPLDIELLPGTRGPRVRLLDEWGSNVRRAFKLREDVKNVVGKYLENSDADERGRAAAWPWLQNP